MVSKQEELEAFMAEERVPGFYAGLTEEEKIARNLQYTQLKIEADIEKAKITAFNEAKQEAFDTFEQQKNVEKQALGATWQTAEDNNYTIPQ